ncbi:hypothetical protein AAV35_000595 [Salimicrobium jeotgali]|uniref:Uncharacterized protein n=2 Tax=Salimicrobium TaxID=351195 RepID=K2G6D2_9BACI|nr:hypothetical protein AAV35_000595 [Salimicrobium jeotgali]EKE30743.1 hypothetical protein MJ3_12275 [Salimicrobium jeotgali]PBB06888.1 hypothetical protein CKW00_00050 [Salimicrobium humidisoli]
MPIQLGNAIISNVFINAQVSLQTYRWKYRNSNLQENKMLVPFLLLSKQFLCFICFFPNKKEATFMKTPKP